jgi:hypothetical protein
MEELDSGSQLIYNGLDFHWVQVVKYVGAPDIKIEGVLFDVYGYQKWARDKQHPFSRLELIPNGGQVSVIVGQWFEAAEVQQQGGAGQGGANTSTNELDSGPIAIGPGEVVPIITTNLARARGVTVQNIGNTVIALSKSGFGAALDGAAILLAPGAAVQDGSGDVATFDGWLGPIFAANVAGGPGSVLVSAF